jgi:hypothetical protein
MQYPGTIGLQIKSSPAHGNHKLHEPTITHQFHPKCSHGQHINHDLAYSLRGLLLGAYLNNSPRPTPSFSY